MDKLDELGVESYVNARCTAVTDDGVTVVGEDGQEFKLTADAVVTALGLKSLTEQVEAIKDALPEGTICHVLGDCHAIDRVGDANLDGYIAGNMIQ